MAVVPFEGAIEPSAQPPGLAHVEDDQVHIAKRLLQQFRRRRAGWLGHFRSFVGVNLGLASINVLTGIAAESFFPWFLFVTASWGIGLTIHGLSHRGWFKDRERSIENAETLLGVSRLDDDLLLLPAGPGEAAPELEASAEEVPALPAGEGEAAGARDDAAWAELMESCRDAVDAAHRALDKAEVDEDVGATTREQLTKGLQTIEVVQRGSRAIREAIRAVAPKGSESLDDELTTVKARIAGATDERLKGVYEANLRLLEARRHKLDALMAEEERMKATVEGFLLAAQNVRLDAARLGAGHVPGRLSSLGDSLERLDQEVEVVRQVEAELEMF